MDVLDYGFINDRGVDQRTYRLQPFSEKSGFQVIKKSDRNISVIVTLASGAVISFPYPDIVYNGDHFGPEDAQVRNIRVYLSPDAQHFLIEKHLNSRDNVGLAFQRVGKSARPYRINGLPFDEACIEYFCRTHHIPLDRVSDGGRHFFPISWRGKAMSVIEISSSSSGFHGNKHSSIFFRVEYDFTHHRFLSARQLSSFG